MRTCAVLLTMAVIVCGPAWVASGVTTMEVVRDVAGLDGGGWFIPGTTELTFTMTFTLGGDMEAVTALAWEDELPAGWTYQSASLSATPMPFIAPSDGASGTLQFAWITIPAFPFTMSYTVDVPVSPTLPATVTGQSEFRTGGAALFSNVVATVIELEPTTMTVARALAGTVGPGGAFYQPGSEIEITIDFTRTGTEDITAFAFSDELPPDWSFVGGSLVASPMPFIAPAADATGTLEFAWITIPTFPFTIQYRIAVPLSATGLQCLSGVSEFRTSGPALFSNTVLDCLDEIPCLSISRNIPATCYTAGAPLTIEVIFESACTESITALGLEETLPAGWSFVSASGAPMPFITPAPGATGLLEFAWITIPDFPYTFTYVVNVPVDQEDDVIISGEAIYRLLGPELRT
ncbi:MAG TPA: hypothetical protein ENN65_01520, partial [Candidatus Hydrogenedentes bacterium]|nr:hypothetical protein [Candidatus Hydrogenedentota bacterium]